MPNPDILRFSLGPVQSFIAQSRRTRDLWAGSFLLSWLTGHAMRAVLDKKDSEIVFPCVHNASREPTDPLLKAIMKISGHESPQVATLPNQFKARVPDGFDPEACKRAVMDKWRKLASKVHEEFLAGALSGMTPDQRRRTDAIWNMQIEHFWEINWVIGPDPGDRGDGDWLDMRKNWRNHYIPDEKEAGDHCTLMGEWQELSGCVRTRGESQAQYEFWENVRKYISCIRRDVNKKDPGVGCLNLRETERLCTIAFIKRMFPKLSREGLEATIGWVPGEETRRIGNWPSTAHLAAAHWMERACKLDPGRCENYVNEIKKLMHDDVKKDPGMFGETMTEIECVKKCEAGDFARLDGYYFFAAELDNSASTFFQPDNVQKDGESRDNAKAALKELQKTVKEKATMRGETLPDATPFYAILLMDGDRAGALARKMDETDFSHRLNDFANGVKGIVQAHNGALLYAGGDDVLALLPMEDAIPCAVALRAEYAQAFDHHPDATISGAIVYAHYHLPLRSMLNDAHEQLTKVAKERNGRNSLAITVWKGSGRHLEWVSTWCGAGGVQPPQLLVELADAFRRKEQFSSRFFYNIRSRFDTLVDDKGKLLEGLDRKQAVQMLVAEYIKNRDWQKDQTHPDRLAIAQSDVERIYSVCEAHSAKPLPQATLISDGALLVRFLARQGLEL